MNDTMTLSQRADALEQRMSDELDYIVIKSGSIPWRMPI